MNPQFIRDDLLIQGFLSGKLSENDREEFLSDYLGDAQRMQQLREYLREHEIPERFLRGELSGDELDAFETLSIADPELFEELQVIERTTKGMQDLDKAGELAEKHGEAAWPSFFNSPVYAAAASVLLVASLVFSGVTFRENLSLREDLALSGEPETTRLVLLEAFRNGSSNSVPQPLEDEWTVLLVNPTLTDYASYRVTLQRLTGDTREPVWQQSGLILTYDSRLAIGVPGELLTIGQYEIVIEGRPNDEAVDAEFEWITDILVDVVPAE